MRLHKVELRIHWAATEMSIETTLAIGNLVGCANLTSEPLVPGGGGGGVTPYILYGTDVPLE